jgi:hypothetical protein
MNGPQPSLISYSQLSLASFRNSADTAVRLRIRYQKFVLRALAKLRIIIGNDAIVLNLGWHARLPSIRRLIEE